MFCKSNYIEKKKLSKNIFNNNIIDYNFIIKLHKKTRNHKYYKFIYYVMSIVINLPIIILNNDNNLIFGVENGNILKSIKDINLSKALCIRFYFNLYNRIPYSIRVLYYK